MGRKALSFKQDAGLSLSEASMKRMITVHEFYEKWGEQAGIAYARYVNAQRDLYLIQSAIEAVESQGDGEEES